MDTIHAFATFLTENCSCDVVFEEWEENVIRNKGFFRWITDEFSRADKLLLISSEGAYSTYRDNRDNQTEVKPPLNQPTNQTESSCKFLLAITNMEMEYVNNGPGRILMVRFPYTPEQYTIKDIIKAPVFEIPRQLDTLLMRIHNLNKYNQNGDIISIPDCRGNTYDKLPKGPALKRAIEAATRYSIVTPMRCDEEYQKDSGVSGMSIHLKDANLPGDGDKISEPSVYQGPKCEHGTSFSMPSDDHLGYSDDESCCRSLILFPPDDGSDLSSLCNSELDRSQSSSDLGSAMFAPMDRFTSEEGIDDSAMFTRSSSM